MNRPPEHLVHGVDGPVVILSARVCAYLGRYGGLDQFRVSHRGRDGEVDAALQAISAVAKKWRDSATGTKVAGPAEPEPQSGQAETTWMTTTRAGTLLGVTDRAIRKAIQEGRMPGAKRVGKQWQVTRADVEHFRAGRRAA